MITLRGVLVETMMLLTSSSVMADGVVVKGNVFGGGNSADVKINTIVNISAGNVEGNVYGGGNVGSVGTYDTSDDMKTFTFTANTGVSNVTITGGTIGTGVAMSADGTFDNGNVYGAGKGKADTYWCEKAMVYKTNVTIEAGTVKGTVYGGGEVGRVEDDAKVTIGDGTNAPTITGNVFGAGAGIKTHGYSALVRGNSDVTVQGAAQVGGSVYAVDTVPSLFRVMQKLEKVAQVITSLVPARVLRLLLILLMILRITKACKSKQIVRKMQTVL